MGDLGFIRETTEESARRDGANILHSYYHPFWDEMVVSGVTVLSESHIIIHMARTQFCINRCFYV